MTLLHPWSWILKSMQNAFLNAHAGSAGLQQPQYIFSRAFGSILWISVWWGLLSCYGQAIMLSDLGWKIFLSLWRNSWLFFFFFGCLHFLWKPREVPQASEALQRTQEWELSESFSFHELIRGHRAGMGLSPCWVLRGFILGKDHLVGQAGQYFLLNWVV